MWKNVVEPQLTIWRKRLEGWIPKAANTHSEYVIIIAFPLQQWLHDWPRYYVIRTLPVFFPVLKFGVLYCFKSYMYQVRYPVGPLYLLKVKRFF
jgi:hypothetical protein